MGDDFNRTFQNGWLLIHPITGDIKCNAISWQRSAIKKLNFGPTRKLYSHCVCFQYKHAHTYTTPTTHRYTGVENRIVRLSLGRCMCVFVCMCVVWGKKKWRFASGRVLVLSLWLCALFHRYTNTCTAAERDTHTGVHTIKMIALACRMTGWEVVMGKGVLYVEPWSSRAAFDGWVRSHEPDVTIQMPKFSSQHTCTHTHTHT